jgi:uncharacterized protein YaaR (DUF327 family)
MEDMDKVDFNISSVLNASSHPGLKAESKKTRAKGGVSGSGRTLFSRVLENAVQEAGELGPLRELEPSEEALTELMDAVHSAGSDLIDKPFNEEILRYKRAVRDFIHYVVENAFSVEKSQTRRRGKNKTLEIKTHTQVQIIDKKLEELAAAILSGQATQLERVAKIEEIKGLLVDLTISGVIRERDE